MNCQDIKRLLIPYLESDLSGSDKAAIEEHLHKCDGCQKEKMLLEKTWSMLDASGTPQVSKNFTENLMAKIHTQKTVKPEFVFAFPQIRIQFGFRTLVPVAASVCVLIAAYIFVQNQLTYKQQSAKGLLPIETAMQATKESADSTVTKLEEDERSGITAADEEIIRNLDVYEDIEMYQNYALLNDMDIVENMGAKGF